MRSKDKKDYIQQATKKLVSSYEKSHKLFLRVYSGFHALKENFQYNNTTEKQYKKKAEKKPLLTIFD
jgi:hypothetical protein